MNDHLGQTFAADLLSEGINFHVILEQNMQVANVWIKRRCVYTESGQANSFCDLHSGPVFNLQKKKLLFLFCFSYFQDIYNPFDISPNFKINGVHAYTVFPGLSYMDRFLKALRELFTCL